MDIYGICPACGQKTKLDNLNACYCMCGSCFEIYNIMGEAEIQGIKLSKDRKSELLDEIEKDIRPKITNWRCV